MKTPTDLLFAIHRSAVPKLDAIRCEVVARHGATTGHVGVGARAGLFTHLWLELIWPCRRIWTGLAAVWVLLLIVSLSQRDDSRTVLAQSPQSAEMMMALRQQEQKLNELLADRH
jgi:hypothetical protein